MMVTSTENQKAETKELAKVMFDCQVFVAEEEIKDEKMCKLVGWNAKIENSNEKKQVLPKEALLFGTCSGLAPSFWTK